MAQQLDWPTLLKERFPIFKVEEEAYVDSLEIATSTEVYIERIYLAILSDVNVPANLKALYREASRGGGDKDVVKRIKNRIGNIRRHCRLVIFAQHFSAACQCTLHNSSYYNVIIVEGILNADSMICYMPSIRLICL